ncbi:polysaccharide pyruvyl transferase family protein [Soonwooa sp.]|uniref:polysaccharide pyruvyl transferase family protein n=1 Tax=Soonwooa sp. TaxID=1938592 RepID=UPI0028A8E588|nr:polysaccharide pyruvyl transferase family protein [Soonwooa sp.]
MQIKTITCHEVYNHGASLQEYALLRFLNDAGHDAQVIHYKPPYLSQHFNLWGISNPKFNLPLVKQLYLLAKLPGRLKALQRRDHFDAFHKAYIPTDSTLYQSNEALKNNLPQADIYICGSDQIWNSFFQNGKDPAFYLNFVPNDKKKIAYAASFAIDEVAEEIQPLVRDNVATFDEVGVRETSGLRILQNLGITNAVQVLDPVFLLDADFWQQTFVKPIEDQFIFIYDFDSNPLIKEIALELKKKLKCKIYTVNQNIDYADKNFYLEGPEKFLSLVYYSQYTITNSFHAVAFSLIFEKQIVVVNRSEKINTRMRDLLALFSLEKRLISTKEEYARLDSINFSDLKMSKQYHIKRSKEFLLNAIQS